MNDRFRLQVITRVFILTGLLLSLLFSSGEGVQLCPFPVAEMQLSRQISSPSFDVFGLPDTPPVEQVLKRFGSKLARPQNDGPEAVGFHPGRSAVVCRFHALLGPDGDAAAFPQPYFVDPNCGRAPPRV